MRTNFVVENHKKKLRWINITKDILEAIADIRDGIMLCSIPHTTASLIICEDDPELREDFIKIAEKLAGECTSLQPYQK